MDEPETDYLLLGQKLTEYCKKYSIPLQFFFDIVNDQKVLPMLRGKGMEYNVFLKAREVLDANTWEVTKLNLGASPGILDEDISIRHRRAGDQLIVESKSAARGSITAGTRARRHKVPHFTVKCHRSRSYIGREGNDKYKATDFAVLVSNPSNALFAKGTIGAELEIISDPATLDALYRYYSVSTPDALLQATGNDWRFVLTTNIADVDGFIPRFPVVYLENDPHWLPMSELGNKVEEVVRQRVAGRRSHRNS